jgi:hypothetical protein
MKKNHEKAVPKKRYETREEEKGHGKRKKKDKRTASDHRR